LKELLVNEAKKPALDQPVHELIASRWSPYVFADRLVSEEDLLSVFEAARWAPSAYNEQPWRYIVATRDKSAEFERLLSCLVEPNQAWAKQAPVLALGVISLNFARNNRPNRTAPHDLGLASANLSLEATARGLSVHQMSGILPDRARELYRIPGGFEALTCLALGYPGDATGELGDRDRSPRSRRPLREFMFAGAFGQSYLSQES
jgi:nitroreductase